MSSDITFLVPSGLDILTLFSIPVTDDVSLTSPVSESDSLSSHIVDLHYPGNDGYRVVNGTKSAIDNITVTFCDEESAELFQKMVEKQKNGGAAKAFTRTSGPSSKQSMMLIDMSLNSDDELTDSRRSGVESINADISEIDISSPLHKATQRALQSKYANTAMSDTPRMPSGKSDDVTSMLKSTRHDTLGERLQASQEGPTHSQSVIAADPGRSEYARSSQGEESPHMKEVTQQGSSPLHLLSNAARGTPASVSQTSACDSTKSKPARSMPKRSADDTRAKPPPIGSKRVSTNEDDVDGNDVQGPKHKRNKGDTAMARLAKAQSESQSRPQVSTSSSKASLKRRAFKDPAADRSGRSQRLSNHTAASEEYDFPSEEEDSQPKKKAKTKNNKQPTKQVGKDLGLKSVGKKLPSITKNVLNKAKLTQKADKSPVADSQKTAASSRARRNAKTPKYVEDSDESGPDASEKGHEDQQLSKQTRKAGKTQETAEDSYPLSKGNEEAALNSADLSFESKLQELVDTKRSDTSPSPKGKTTRNSPLLELLNPRISRRRLSENSIPAVSEKLLRKTSIVQFGPEGPRNQAVRQSASVSGLDEITNVTGSPEIQNSQPALWKQDDGDVEVTEAVAQNDAFEGGDLEKCGFEREEQSSPEGFNELEASEYLVSGDEERSSERSASPQNLENQELGKPQVDSFRLQTPLLKDGERPQGLARAKEVRVAHKTLRRSIGVSAILDEEYPEAEKIINADKLRPISQAGTEITIGKINDPVVHPTSNVEMYQTATGKSNENNIPTFKERAPAPLHSSAMPRYRSPRSLLQTMGPPPPPRSVPAKTRRQLDVPRKSWPDLQTRHGTEQLQTQANSHAPRPIRVKKKLPVVGVEPAPGPNDGPEIQPGTPLSFCTRLEAKAPVLAEMSTDVEDSRCSEGKDVAQQPGNGSLTLINDEDSLPADISALRFGLDRRRPSGSTDFDSADDSVPGRDDSGHGRDGQLPQQFRVRESQQGLLDAIIHITNVRLNSR